MRSMVCRMLSICSWFASFSSTLRPALLADWPTRLCTSSSRLLTSCRPPSATLTTCSARSALPMAASIDACWLRRFSLAIRPAGSSAPRLICRPVDRRSSDVFRARFCWPRTRWPSSEFTLVLIRLIGFSPSLRTRPKNHGGRATGSKRGLGHRRVVAAFLIGPHLRKLAGPRACPTRPGVGSCRLWRVRRRRCPLGASRAVIIGVRKAGFFAKKLAILRFSFGGPATGPRTRADPFSLFKMGPFTGTRCPHRGKAFFCRGFEPLTASDGR